MTRRVLPSPLNHPSRLGRVQYGIVSAAGTFEPVGTAANRVLRDLELAVERGCTDALAEITDEAYRRDNERLAAEIERLQANEYRPPDLFPSAPGSGVGHHASDARPAGVSGGHFPGQSEERSRETGGPGMSRETADRGGITESGPGEVGPSPGSAPDRRAAE